MIFDNGRGSGDPALPPIMRQEEPDVLVLDSYSGEFYAAELSRFIEKKKFYVLEDASSHSERLFRIYGPFQLRGIASHLCRQFEGAELVMGFDLMQRASQLEAVQLMGTEVPKVMRE
jgi:hypothetical protein